MYHSCSRVALFAALLAAGLMAASGSSAQSVAPVVDRAAKGDLSQHGGARRTTSEHTQRARNVILLIGDGMGDSEITVARNYARGAGGYFPGIDALPISGQYTHYSLDAATGKPVYVPDSAATATAWASGVKTYNSALGVDIRGRSHATLLELSKKAGLATGNVSTAAIQDATPGAQYAHVATRACFGPADATKNCPDQARQNGGAGSISEQLLDVRPDVSLGGGAAPFAEAALAGDWKGKTLIHQAKARGFQIVEDADSLAKVTAADQKTPVLGLFSPGHMPVRWLGPTAIRHGNRDVAPVTCALNPARTAQIPTLAVMTRKAIDLLKDDSTGFFLQVEGASIDKQDHAANPCGQIGETVDLDEAVQVALAFAKDRTDTLVIVTADHAHTSQIVSPDANSPGLTLNLVTKDGAVMGVNYATAETGSQSHTGTQLRIAAFGPNAERVQGLTDQTDLFFTIRDALGLR
ncbi:alkaline phosphatase [Caulobacter segnis]|uniref:alkaline phosphatase n=1 Tax=Caulobacter segnis TaxID=88688 RepID=UPI00240EE7EF|nr:alkaline phosphatase [Caulobacter segnis]MDG2520696.1 alkaline phosphatase [Caulobacter segnis]